ncbi:hypothetical protein [Bacteroides sp.]
MVTGIDKFKEYFAQYEDNYIIIGGTACDMIEVFERLCSVFHIDL